MGQNEDAIKSFKQAIELNPKNIKALQNQAVSHERLNQFEAALSDYNSVLS